MQQEINRFKNPLVRDLAWSLLSPPLMSEKNPAALWVDNTWCQQSYQDSLQQLLALDKQPEALTKEVKPWPGARLGKYNESLWSYWFRHHLDYELLYENLQLNVDGITVGEFDFIVRDLKTGKICHWEVAVKFYLGYNNTLHQSSWYGLQFNDRLDVKVNRIIDHQCQLSQLPAGREFLASKNIVIDETRVIVKGRLFYPPESEQGPEGSHPDHLKCQWKTLQQFNQDHQKHSLKWIALNKSEWLAPRSPDQDGLSFENLIDDFEQQKKSLPVSVAGLDNEKEVFRIFVLPDGWTLPDNKKP